MVWGILLLCLCMVIRGAAGMLHPVRSFLASALCGIAALGAVCALEGYTGVSLPVSPLSGLVSGLLGVPGVIAMLLVKLL